MPSALNLTHKGPSAVLHVRRFVHFQVTFSRNLTGLIAFFVPPSQSPTHIKAEWFRPLESLLFPSLTHTYITQSPKEPYNLVISIPVVSLYHHHPCQYGSPSLVSRSVCLLVCYNHPPALPQISKLPDPLPLPKPKLAVVERTFNRPVVYVEQSKLSGSARRYIL